MPWQRGAASPSGSSRMTAQLKSWARALGGEVSGRGVICPGPGHSARDRSLSVTPCATAPNSFLVNSFAGDDLLVCLDYVRARLGLSPFRPGQASKVAPQRERKPADEARQASDNREAALNIWRQSVDPRGTIVEDYRARAASNCRTRPRMNRSGFMRPALSVPNASRRWFAS
jgi:class 3 adenylate cyclase